MNGRDAPVVVGVDGSAPSLAALRLAVRDAVSGRSPLQVLAVSERLAHHDRTCTCRRPGGTLCVDTAEEVLTAADRVVAEEVHRAPGPRTTWTTGMRFGSAGAALAEAALDARMLAAGIRGRRDPQDAPIGTTASLLAAEAPAPVMLAHPGDADRPPPAPQIRPQVVAAVAGDARDRDVLRLAGEWAERHHAQLHVVHSLAGHANGRDRGRTGDHAAGNRRAWVAQPVRPRGGLVTTLTYRSAEVAVPTLAGGASLVVIGTSGRPALNGRAGGSVSRSVLSGLHCPVLVLPPGT